MSLRSVLFMASEVECVVFMNRCVSRKLGTQMQVEINKLQISRESQRVKPGLYRETELWKKCMDDATEED